MIQFARARPDAALVVPTTCDQLRRGGDDLGVGCQSRVFLFNFPATWQTTTARDLYRNELERLSGFLTCLGGKRPSQERLRSVMLDRSSARRLLLDLAAWCHGRAYARMVARYHWDGTAAFPGSGGESAVERVRLALVGGPMTVAQWSIFDIIDEAGGRVALDGTEGGERSLPPPIEPEVFEGELPCALAHFYFDHCVDVFQRPNTRLHGWLAERIGTRQIRGVLLWQHTNCDLWRAETESLRETLKLPLIALNADETQTIPQRLAVRVEAFVESLR